MRYLITGGAGFIGSHLSEALLASGHEVTVLDDLSTGRLENITHLRSDPRFRFVAGSVLDPLIVDECVAASDGVLHLAAAVGVQLVVKQPLKSLMTNIRGSENVLEAAHRYRRFILIASTSEIYGRNSEGPLDENADRILGSPRVTRWAYSTSKAVDEILAFAYQRERGLPTVVVRFFNTVGPRQSAAYGMVIPRLVRQALLGEPLTVYGDGTQRRTFCHVHDVVRAICGVVDEPRALGDVFNIGGSREISIGDLASLVIERTASTSGIRLVPFEEAYEPGFEDVERRVPDTSKLNRLTGWAPTKTLEEIIDDVIVTMRADLAGPRAPEPAGAPVLRG